MPWLVGKDAEARAWTEAAKIWLLLMALQAFALLTAGLFWLGPTFVQLSLWRFSPHAKLLAVSAAAVWLLTPSPSSVRLRIIIYAMFALSVVCMVASAFNSGDLALLARLLILGTAISLVGLTAMISCVRDRPLPSFVGAWLTFAIPLAFAAPLFVSGKIGPIGQPPPDAAVLAAAAWAEANTPRDALFLLPPDASAFSVNARRGQVVSFKLVPQLAGELAEWDQRLRDVLDVPDLNVYAGGFAGYRTAQQKMRERYDALSSEHLFKVARAYGARYVFRSKQDPDADAPVVWRGTNGATLYDLGQPEPQ